MPPHKSQSSCGSSRSRHVRPSFLNLKPDSATFGGVMGLLDLDKIIIKRTILGIRCSACGGNLVVSKKRSFAARLVKITSLGSIKAESYECETCKKGFLLI
ncbi:hypothetical protein [Dyadobacter bucti]|uniref:hypothetical protein n=1 Tax=Dyadobacter bucti TaxID=2572203 RepID=UPI0011084E69|nr:hypothetical protein [Dyadobacter bucti]